MIRKNIFHWVFQNDRERSGSTFFVDTSHANYKDTRRYHSGVFIFVNKAPIVFFSKRQNSV